MRKKLTAAAIAVFCCTILLFSAASAADFTYKGEINVTDDTTQLLKFYVDKFDPEELELIIDEPPDNGRFRNIYMNIKGCNVSNVRIDSLCVQILDAQFNSPEHWASGDVECKSALNAYAFCRLLEDDINADLKQRTIGNGDDNWKNITLNITPNGLKGRGEYTVSLLFTFDILIEVESGLRVEKGQEIWLENTILRVNRLDVPDYVTNMALEKIQPLLNLSKVPIPMKLHRVIMKDKEALFETRLPPTKFDGITYIYSR